MFELTADQMRVLEALLSPFGLILVVQAAKWLAKRVGLTVGRVQIRAFLALVSAGLAYFWLMPGWPELPACQAVEACLDEVATFVSALAALGSAWYGAAHLIYERLAKGLFERLGGN